MSLQGPGSTFLRRTAFRSLRWDVVGQSQPAQGQSPSSLPQGSCCCHPRAITLRLLRDWLSTLTSRLRGREELSQACERWWQSLGAQQRPQHWTGWLGNQPPKWRKIDPCISPYVNYMSIKVNVKKKHKSDYVITLLNTFQCLPICSFNKY